MEPQVWVGGYRIDMVVSDGARQIAVECDGDRFHGADESGPSLERVLAEARIDDVDVCGIAESHRVKATALDARRLGPPTTVLSDLTVPVTPELGARARAELHAAGVAQRSSAEAADRG